MRIECSKETELEESQRGAIGDHGNSPNFQFKQRDPG